MKVFAGILIVLFLLILLIFALPFLIDLNKYQDQYRPVIEDALNRKITLKNIRLTIWPRIGVRVNGFTVLDDPNFSSAPFASLTSLDVGVKLMPLLSKRVEIEEITLRDPIITVIKNQVGIMNISTLGPRSPAKPKEMVPTEPTGGPLRALALLAVDQLSITGGKLTYRDLSRAKPSEYSVDDMHLEVKSVRMGAMPTLRLTATVQPYHFPVGVHGRFGPLAETADIKSFDFQIKTGKSTTLNLTGSAVGGKLDMTASAPLISTADLPVTVALTKAVEIKDLHLTAHANYPPKHGVPPLELADVKDLGLTIALGNSAIQVKGTLLGGHARVNADAPSINSDDVPVALPLKKPVEVKNLQLMADMQGQEVRLSNLSFQLFNGQVKSQGGATVGVRPLPFNGKVSVQSLQLGPALEAVGPDKVTVSGTAAANLSVQGRGFTKDDLRRALEGTGNFAIKDGKIEGINLLQEALAVLRAVGISQDTVKATVFSTVEGDLGVQQGIIKIQRLLADSRDYQTTATGTVGFDKTLDLRANVNLSEALSRKIAGLSPAAKVAFAKGRMSIPLIISGTAQSPSFSLDSRAIGGRVQEQVKEQVQGAVDDVLKGKKSPKDLQKQGEDLLKGIFGR